LNPVSLRVNGRSVSAEAEPRTHLGDFLRDELRLTGTHLGCEHGVCGACTVLVDGEARRSCLVPLAAVDGATITTVEGLGAADDLSPVQAAFDEHYAAQCGFCTSGFIMAATALIDRTPKANREEILAGLSGHVCRCTGYIKIVSAVEAAAKGDVHPEKVEPSFEPEEAAVLIPGSPA
jgi:aerobic carbon-monoxide dehydrogenase small subunit